MAVYAILHTSTGVVRRVTTDPLHAINSDETKVEVPSVDFSAGRPKYVAGVFSPASPEEIDSADLLPYPAEVQAIKDAIAAIVADGTLPARLKAFVSALNVIYRQPRVGIK